MKSALSRAFNRLLTCSWYKWEEYKRTVLDDVLPRKGRFAGR